MCVRSQCHVPECMLAVGTVTGLISRCVGMFSPEGVFCVCIPIQTG